MCIRDMIQREGLGGYDPAALEPAEDEELTLRIHMPSAPGSVTMDGAPGSSWRQADGFLTVVVPAGGACVEVEWAE